MSLINRVSRLLLAVCAILLAAPSLAAGQSTGIVSGVVADSAGAPIVGARVSVDGASIATSSAQNGRFTLVGVAPGSRTIRARLLGYRLGELTVAVAGGQTVTANFRLGRAPVELEQVVSTGYGTQSRASVTGATDVVSGTEITKRPVSNITKGLQGLMPGVTVRDFGGRPGGDGGEIRIRGVGTLGNSNPLILVDGVPGEINNLDPLNIESVSVLKDAASAAIYGARGANGVILIKTVRGRNTGGLKLSYDGYVASQEAQDMPERADIRTELEAVNWVYTYNGQPAKYTPGFIDSTAAGLDPFKYPNTNWLDLIYRTAPLTNQTLRVTGGNDLAALNVSANYFDQQGILDTENYYKRFSLRGNTDFNITKRLTATADLSLMNEKVLRPVGEGDAQFRALHDTPPTSLAKYPDGSYSWTRSSFNPLAQLRERGYNDSRWRTTVLNTMATYAMENGLRFRGMLTGDNKDNRGLEFEPRYAFTEPTKPGTFPMQRTRTRSRDTRNNDFNIQGTLTGEFERAFGAHATHVLVGVEQRRTDHDDVFAEREGAYNNDLQLPGSGDVSFQSTGSGANSVRIASQFGRLNYGYNNKYLLEANLRRDGSSRFGPDRRYGVFPSFSAAWRASEESFFKNNVGFINDLKFRASWGRTGNDRIDNYLYQQTINLNSGNYNFNNALATGATPGRIGNPEIGWESTEQTNFGVDAEFMQGKLSFIGDVYNKETSGILFTVPVSSLTGQSAPVRNAAEMGNKGWETALTWRDDVGAVNYSVGFNLSDNKNQILHLPGGDQINGSSINRVGQPRDAIFGLQTAGLFQTQAEVAAWASQHAKTGPGDLKFVDQNGDKKIDSNDRVIIGDPNPHYTYGMHGSAQFRSLDFSVLFSGVGKHDQYMDGALIEGPTWENFFPVYLLDSWRPENPDAEFPRFAFRSDHNQNFTGRNDKYVRDGRYLSLKNIQLGYTLPSRLTGRAGISSARVYVSGANVYTWSKLKGLLPAELNPGSSRGTYYYQTRNISIGTSIGM